MQHCKEQATTFVQRTETDFLVKLAAHVQACKKLLNTAEKRAHNKKEGGCGCNSCRNAVTTAQERLQQAIQTYKNERTRLYGEHEDQEVI